MQARIKQYKLDDSKIYSIIKLKEDGTRKLISAGHVAPLEVGCSALIGSWVTTAVQEITLVGKGVIIETLNSTYLIEEFTGDAFLDAHEDES